MLPHLERLKSHLQDFHPMFRMSRQGRKIIANTINHCRYLYGKSIARNYYQNLVKSKIIREKPIHVLRRSENGSNRNKKT